MRYLVMHKAGPQDEAGVPPPQKLIAEMGQLIGEAVKAGIFLAGEGLRPSSQRLRLSCRGGDFTVTKGPYAGRNELPAAMASITVRTQDEAIAWGKRFAAAIGGDLELEIGLLVEEWDLGGEKPAGEVPLRFLVIQKATAATEAGAQPAAASRAAVAKLMAESERDGVLQLFETLQPSSRARRLLYRGDRRDVVDGPFVESKELIGGFCMLQLRSLDEVIAWADRYARIIGGSLEVDVRAVAEPVAGGAR